MQKATSNPASPETRLISLHRLRHDERNGGLALLSCPRWPTIRPTPATGHPPVASGPMPNGVAPEESRSAPLPAGSAARRTPAPQLSDRTQTQLSDPVSPLPPLLPVELPDERARRDHVPLRHRIAPVAARQESMMRCPGEPIRRDR